MTTRRLAPRLRRLALETLLRDRLKEITPYFAGGVETEEQLDEAAATRP